MTRQNDMRETRIALTGGYPPPFGGVSITVLQLAEQLMKDQYSMRVFASNPLASNAPEYATYCRLRSLNDSATGSRNLVAEIAKFKPDIVHSHASTIDWRMSLVAKALAIPVLHHVHGERFPQQFAQMSLAQRAVIRLCIRTAASIIAASSDLADFIVSLGADSRHVFVVPSLLPLEESLYSRAESGSSTQLRLVTSGYFPFTNTHYGFDLVPPVAKTLLDHSIRFTWYLVGQADEKEAKSFGQKLADYGVQEHVRVTGELDRPHMLALLRDAHLYVRTKYSDSFGIVIAEAHQLGCHCLFGDNNPYFQEGPRLTKYHTGDVNSLTEKVLETISQIILCKPQHVHSHFAAEAQGNYEAIRQIYAEIGAK